MTDDGILELTLRDTLFLNWAVDPETVSTRLPCDLDVATFDGTAYLGVVPLVMGNVRVRGLPGGPSFPQLNLRTYVDGPQGRGVYFFSIDADAPFGAHFGRLLLGLPTYRASIDVRRESTAAEATPGRRNHSTNRRIHFTSHRTRSANHRTRSANHRHQRDPPPEHSTNHRHHRDALPAHFDATYEPSGPRFQAESGSLESFLTENYRFYVDGRRRFHGEIDHDPWQLREATASIRANTLFEAVGFSTPTGAPVVHLGSAVAVTAGSIGWR